VIKLITLGINMLPSKVVSISRSRCPWWSIDQRTHLAPPALEQAGEHAVWGCYWASSNR
jgi:hypothetical protein